MVVNAGCREKDLAHIGTHMKAFQARSTRHSTADAGRLGRTWYTVATWRAPWLRATLRRASLRPHRWRTSEQCQNERERGAAWK